MSDDRQSWEADYDRVVKLVDALTDATAETERAADTAGHDEWRSRCNAELAAYEAVLRAVAALAKRANGRPSRDPGDNQDPDNIEVAIEMADFDEEAL